MNNELLTIFDNLTKTEQRAFIGWFGGGKSLVTKYATRDYVFFGKSECEQVDFKDFWQGKLATLGWITLTIVNKFVAKGMVGTPEAIEYHIQPTELGLEIHKAYWSRINKKLEQIRLEDY